jgi:hypothetical protein
MAGVEANRHIDCRDAWRRDVGAAGRAGDAADFLAFRDRLRHEASKALFMKGKKKLVGVEFGEMADGSLPDSPVSPGRVQTVWLDWEDEQRDQPSGYAGADGPSLVTVLDSSWRRRGTFVHAGWIEMIQWLSPDRLAISGYSNEQESGVAALLDPAALDGQAPVDPASPFYCASCGRTAPLRYVAFPRSEVNRAGGSVWEIAAAGRPAILVPYPHATADHQTLKITIDRVIS